MTEKLKIKIISLIMFCLNFICFLLGFVKINPDEILYNHFVIFVISIPLATLLSLVIYILIHSQRIDSFRMYFFNGFFIIVTLFNILGYIVCINMVKHSTTVVLVLIISIACVFLSICNIKICKNNTDKIFGANNDLLSSMHKELTIGIVLAIVSLTLVLGGYLIPFNETTTEEHSFIDYDPSIGFDEKHYYTTEIIGSSSSISSPLFVPIIIIYIILVIIFLISEYKGEIYCDEERLYKFGILLAIVAQISSFIAVGGWSIIFGPGLFIALSLLIIRLAGHFVSSAECTKRVYLDRTKK